MLTYDVATRSRNRHPQSLVMFAARSFVRYQVSNTRRYSTSSAFNSFIRPRTPLDFFLLVTGGGVGWFGYNWFHDNYLRSETKQEKSPFDPEKFINFKLKQVIPYNHNTSKCVLTSYV